MLIALKIKQFQIYNELVFQCIISHTKFKLFLVF